MKPKAYESQGLHKSVLEAKDIHEECIIAWRSGLERRFYDDHDRKVNGLTPNLLVLLLRSWIRCFTMIISAWWNLATAIKKSQKQNLTGKLGNKSNS